MIIDRKCWKVFCDQLHVITQGDQEIERIIRSVGPIWGNHEAAEKIRKFMTEQNMLAQGWAWNGAWNSEDGTSYAAFLRIRNMC